MPPGSEKPCAAHDVRITNMEKRQDKVDVILEKIRNRLPVWATCVVSLLTLIIGLLWKMGK